MMIFRSPKSGLISGGLARKKLAFEEIQELLEEDGLQGHSGRGKVMSHRANKLHMPYLTVSI